MKSLSKSLTLAALLMATLFAGCKKEDEDEISSDRLNNGIVMIECKDGSFMSVVNMGFDTQTYWATCNLGASSPEQMGNYFAWAENSSKEAFTRNNYKWFKNGDNLNITKYCNNQNYGGNSKYTDTYSEIESQDDPAVNLYGPKWRTPTVKDYNYLLSHCEKTWGKVNGVWGCLLTSKKKGYENNSIFFPLTGLLNDFGKQYEAKGFYWTRTLDTSSPNKANALWIQIEDGINDASPTASSPREAGLQIRPVVYVK